MSILFAKIIENLEIYLFRDIYVIIVPISFTALPRGRNY